jgi:DeoR/GlpR family transcriptional regulator of sugar metabolism
MMRDKQIPANQRRVQILQQVHSHGSVRLAELMHMFNLSDTTIRRDLSLLEEQQRLKRVRGGAIALRPALASAPFYDKAREHSEEKMRIGMAAANLISPGESIILDSGTTPLQVAIALLQVFKGPMPLTVVTNSLPVVYELQNCNLIRLNLLGGILLPEFQATVGPQTVSDLQQLRVDKAFIGCDGLTLSHGLTTPDMLVAEVGRIMVEVARQVIAVTDSSKLGRAGFTQIVPVERIHMLVTDTGAPPDLVEQIRSLGIQVILV